MNLSPEQFGSLRRVLADPSAKASALTNIPANVLENIFAKIEKFVRNSAADLGASKFLFHYINDHSGGRELSPELLNEMIAAGNFIAAIGNDASLIAADAGIPSLVSASDESEKMSSVSALCSGQEILLFAAGKVIAEIGIAPVNLGDAADWKRSWRELDHSLDDHFEHCVENEKNLRYWEDRVSRTLLAGPDGTEKIFHHSLFWWCSNFIRDAIDVYGEAQAMGQDKTDITIVTDIGNIVVEVKWLGKNENGTSYSQVRIDEGMIQVADYLSRNSKLMKGYLVLYDGRNEDAHKTQSGHVADNKHPKSNTPLIYFLRSETPSIRAVNLARKQRVAKKAAAKKGSVSKKTAAKKGKKKNPK